MHPKDGDDELANDVLELCQKYNQLPPSSFENVVLGPPGCCECDYASLRKKEAGRHQSGFERHGSGTKSHTLPSTGQHLTHISSIRLVGETMRHSLPRLWKSD